MIFYPRKNQDIKEYKLAVIASNNVYKYLKQHVIITAGMNINHAGLIIGDGGLLEEQKQEIKEVLKEKVEFLELNHKNEETGFKTQSDQYRKIIDNRISFLRRIFERQDVERVIQLDADTSIIRNDFSNISRAQINSWTSDIHCVFINYVQIFI